MRPFHVALVLIIAIIEAVCTPLLAAEPTRPAELLAVFAHAGPDGAGAAEAAAALKELDAYGGEILPQVLEALDTDNVLAANWARAVYERIVADELAQPSPEFPLPLLQAYVADGQRAGRARRLVLQLVERVQPGFREQLLPSLLGDREFRHDAVAQQLLRGEQAAAAGDAEAALDCYRSAFEHARDPQQVTSAAQYLQAAGEPVDIAEHLGLVTAWQIVGPFPAPKKTGFGLVFPPEESPSAVDLGATFAGAQGATLAWQGVTVSDPLGQLDLNAALGPTAESVGYAYAELLSEREQSGELRCGADDNLTVWLNGEIVFAREQWLNGIRFDRFSAPVVLREGTNRVLVKVCQGPQHTDPEVPNNWTLVVRFCDADGAGLKLLNQTPPAATPE